MSMLARFAASSGAESYKDIVVVDSGGALGSVPVTFGDILQNDVVMLFIADAASNTYTVPSGYVLGGSGVITGSYRYAWYYKVMGVTPDTGINLSDSNADGSGFTYYVCRGVDTSNPIMSAPSPFSGNNPPAVTTTRKSLVFAAIFGGNNASGNYTAAPAGYSGFQTVDATAFSDADVATGWKNVSSATTEDPGAFTSGSAFSSQISVTIALNPAKGSTAIVGTIPTFVSSSASAVGTTSGTVTAPAGIQNGDLLVAVGICDSASATVSSVPAGFSVISISRAGAATSFIATKIASSESGNYTFSVSAGSKFRAGMTVYRGASRVNTVGPIGSSTTVTLTASNLYPTYRGVLNAVFLNTSASGRSIVTPPSGMTERLKSGWNGLDSGDIAIYESTPQEKENSGDKSLVISSTNSGNLMAFLIQITNEPDITPTFIGVSNTQNAAAGANLVIPKPANTSPGDLMVAFMSADGGTNSWTGDTGWVEVLDQGVSPQVRIAYKIANTSEANTYTFVLSGTGRKLAGAICTYRNAAYDATGAIATGTNPLTANSPSAPYSQSKLIIFGSRPSGSITVTTTAGETMNVILTENDANAPSYIIADTTIPKYAFSSPKLSNFRSITVGATTGPAGVAVTIKPSQEL